MYPEFESCEHILEEIYDFAVERGVCPQNVDDAVHRAYWSHKRQYVGLHGRGAGLDFDLARHQLSVHVLYHHVMSYVEQLVEGRKSSGRHVCRCDHSGKETVLVKTDED